MKLNFVGMRLVRDSALQMPSAGCGTATGAGSPCAASSARAETGSPWRTATCGGDCAAVWLSPRGHLPWQSEYRCFFCERDRKFEQSGPLAPAAHLACDLRLTTWRMALWLAMPGLLLLVLARLLLIAAVAPRSASDVLPPAAAHCAFFSRLKIDYHDVTVATVGGMH